MGRIDAVLKFDDLMYVDGQADTLTDLPEEEKIAMLIPLACSGRWVITLPTRTAYPGADPPQRRWPQQRAPGVSGRFHSQSYYRRSAVSAFPAAREGELSRMRASLVKGDTLAEVARELDLGEYLLLGPGERKSGGHRRGSILADALEAVIGAILLDSDVQQCRSAVLAWFASRLADLDAERRQGCQDPSAGVPAGRACPCRTTNCWTCRARTMSSSFRLPAG